MASVRWLIRGCCLLLALTGRCAAVRLTTDVQEGDPPLFLTPLLHEPRILISEIHYHPPNYDGSASTGKCLDPISGTVRQFVELHNPSPDRNVSLGGYRLTITGALEEIVFSGQHYIPPKGYFLLRPTIASRVLNDSCYLNNTDYTGFDIRTVPRVETPLQCQQVCYGANGCSHWTLNVKSQRCNLKTSDTKQKTSEGLISGLKTGCVNDYLPFEGIIRKTKGEIVFRDATGKVLDHVRYNSKPPWPQGPNGFKLSLERVNTTETEFARNPSHPTTWRASKVDGGTPGYMNSAQNEQGRSYLIHSRAIPHRPTSSDIVTVTAKFSLAEHLLSSVEICYELTEKKTDVVCLAMAYYHEHTEWRVSLLRTIPSQTLVRYMFKLTDKNGFTESNPYASEASPVRSFFVYDGELPRTVVNMWAYGHSWTLRGGTVIPPVTSKLVDPHRVLSAVVIQDSEDEFPVVYEGANTPISKSGNPKVKFLPTQRFRGQRHIKIGSETLEVWIGADKFSPIVECMGFYLYGVAGSPSPWCEHWRVIGAEGFDQVRTVMQIVETPFLVEHGYARDGFLFKAGYSPGIYLKPYPQPMWSCYYPINNLDTSAKEFTEEILAWRIGNASHIDNVVNVDSFVAYGVGTMLTSNWDGTSNNHYLFQDTDSGVWSIFPWDLDKSCGNLKGTETWTYDYPFGALNNHGLKTMNNNWPAANSRPANTILENVYMHPRVGRLVRERMLELVRQGVYAQADVHFNRMVHSMNCTLHEIYGLNMSEPYLPFLQPPSLAASLYSLNKADKAWKTHQVRRANLFFA